MNFTERTTCRVCGGSDLATILDFGPQCLAGQFPAVGEPNPPKAPLELCQCGRCGLVQLRHTVHPDLLFRNYWYRSGVTETMRRHLRGLARECMSKGNWQSVMDVGANDLTLLKEFPRSWMRLGMDPSFSQSELSRVDPESGVICHRGLFPDEWVSGRYDLITSIACFYDVDDPLAFADAVRDRLTPHGVWCVEVANVDAMWAMTAYDAICSEHLVYYDIQALADVCRRSGLVITDYSHNPCNGGSIRAFIQRDDSGMSWAKIPRRLPTDWNRFVARVKENCEQLRSMLQAYFDAGCEIHLLGASTKANTVLQYADVGRFIGTASDRDPRKHGRRTPGTNIPIVSEARSHELRPDVYISVLAHFRHELLQREQAFLDGGGEIVFVLPVCEVVSHKSQEIVNAL